MNRVSAALAACVLLAGCQATAPASQPVPASEPPGWNTAGCTKEKLDSISVLVDRVLGQCFFGTEDDPRGLPPEDEKTDD